MHSYGVIKTQSNTQNKHLHDLELPITTNLERCHGEEDALLLVNCLEF